MRCYKCFILLFSLLFLISCQCSDSSDKCSATSDKCSATSDKCSATSDKCSATSDKGLTSSDKCSTAKDCSKKENVSTSSSNILNKNEGLNSDFVLVSIDDYDLMMSDYRKEFEKLSLAEKTVAQTFVGKKIFLEKLIDKQVLFREAQSLHLENTEDFHFRLESFWKKAMIDSLIAHKKEEFIRKRDVDEKKVEFYYNRLQKQIFARIRVVEEEPVVKKILKEELLTYEEEGQVHNDSGWCWFNYEEIKPVYRMALFQMEENEVRTVYNDGLGWIILEIQKFRSREFESKEAFRKLLMDVLMEEEDEKSLKDWIRQLRSKYQVKVKGDFAKEVEVL
ncbi:hypothetical protein AB834_06035 [PVC group bacterium (ex Bugula neritina AB1)]|nr:hypothetical protein AB834_06035 [PVC group bacterium (ex Bugula neritina AB1)]